MKLLPNGKVSVYDPRTHNGQGSLVEMPVEKVSLLLDTHVVFSTKKEYREWLESEKAHAEAIAALTLTDEDEGEDDDENGPEDWEPE